MCATSGATTHVPDAQSSPTVGEKQPQGQVNEGADQASCRLAVHLKEQEQQRQYLLTWWNQSASVPAQVQLSLSADSTDGNNGTWTTWPTGLTSGGAQVLTLSEEATWLHIQIVPSSSATQPLMGLVELYAVTNDGQTPALPPSPTIAPTPTATPIPTVTPTP